MKRWFNRQPVHRKLVLIALTVTTATVSLAIVGLMGVDLWRYRDAAETDTAALAALLAENTAAAVLFEDPYDAREILATARVRPAVRRACLYLLNGSLFAAFERSPDLACPPAAGGVLPWNVVAGAGGVTVNGRTVGTMYVDQELADLSARLSVALLSGAAMLSLAGLVAFLMARRLHRMISVPIATLAAAARSMGADDSPKALPPIQTGLDEVGDLVRAFSDMLRRVHDASDALRRREAEREELLGREREANRLKDEFLAAVSHELRTPLNAIVGWVQILRTTAADEQTTARAIESIARNAKAQTRVIEDLVDVSRIATGKLNLRFEPIDLREPVEAAVDVIRSTAQAKNIRLDVQLPAMPCLVNGDRDRLQQVVWNLLSNAVKFTASGGAVMVVARGVEAVYTVSVVDTGVGIPAQFLPFAFDRFRQADGSMTREHGGLGLGLAIVKELTTLHDGSVEAHSEGTGRGARFTLRLPALLHPDTAAPPLDAGRRTDPGPNALVGVRVLAVDDNADALDVLSATLRAAGAQVRTALSGETALREWERAPSDILLCDLAMPDMDGFEVLSRMRQHDGAARPIPAVAISAHATEQYRARSLATGFAAHLTKPYRADDLVHAVVLALAQGQARRP